MSKKRNTKVRTPLKGNDFPTMLAETMQGSEPVLIVGFSEKDGFHAMSQMDKEMEMAFCHYLLDNGAKYYGMTIEEYFFKIMRQYDEEWARSKGTG